jgi:hypothetical protein
MQVTTVYNYTRSAVVAFQENGNRFFRFASSLFFTLFDVLWQLVNERATPVLVSDLFPSHFICLNLAIIFLPLPLCTIYSSTWIIYTRTRVHRTVSSRAP